MALTRHLGGEAAMGSKVKFTEGRVQGFECAAGERQALWWDAATPHLGVRVTEAGARSYVYQGRVHRESFRLTIGDVRSWPLAKARAEARRLATLTDRGIDPRDEAAEKRAQAEADRFEAERRDVTVASIWQRYVEHQRARWGERHHDDHIALTHAGGAEKRRGTGRTKAAPLASLMPLKLSELTAERIGHWLKREAGKRSTSAAKAFRLLRAFIRWTADVPEYRGIVPADACTARAVREALPASRAKEGDCLQREQLPAWFRAVRMIGNPVIRPYLQVLLLTGARREELGTLRWADVDFQWCSLTLRDKVEGRRTIPLTPYVSALLAALPRRNEWVFSSTAAKAGRMVEPRIAHNAALGAAGLPHLSLHGLRRSFGTLAEWIEMPTGIVAQIQGHKPSAIAEKHYRRRPIDLLRVWHEKLEGWILEQGGVPFVAPQPANGRLGVVNADGSVKPAA